MNKRPYTAYFDGTADIPIQQQADDPANLRFIPTAAANARTIIGGDANPYVVADQTVNSRGAKNIIWSSEGYISNGNTILGLTSTQKGATHDHTINAGTGALDFSPYRDLLLVVNLVSFTAGTTPTIQFELDYLDDTATPVSLTLWKPTALSTAASVLVAAGTSVPFFQAAAAANAIPTGFAAIVVPSGWTYYPIPLPVLPNGKFAWTVTGTPTGATWSAWLYGIN